MIADLRHLWQEAFGDSDETLDAFFATGFSPDRCHYLTENGKIVTALYWFDCVLDGQKMAYIYAVATKKEYRGRGLATRLMEQTHEILKAQNYAGAILVPGEKSLFSYYEALGYRTATQVEEFPCMAGVPAALVTEINREEYTLLRRKYLPRGGVLQEGAILLYLASYAKFYKGEDFLLAASKTGEDLLAHEILGNTDRCKNILCALGCKNGRFRTPGAGWDFAMFLPLGDGCPKPFYFGLALD